MTANTAPTFVSGSGKVTTVFASYSVGQSIALQADGRILIAGYTNTDFALARYNADGGLDSSFSGDGKLATDFGNGYDLGQSITVQADGKILVAGRSNGKFALARYNGDGSLDTSFSGDGKLTTAFDTTSAANSIALQADGKILVAGLVVGTNTNDFALARYNADGSLDPSFSGDGKLTTDLGDEEQAKNVTVLADGKILVAGFNGLGAFAMARYNADGSPDASFGTNGKKTSDFPAYDFGGNVNSVTVQADGKILATGEAYDQSGKGSFALARYNADGSLDASFSSDGKLTTSFGNAASAKSVTVQADGKILSAGFSDGNFAIARYNADGSLDTSFSGDGKLTTNFNIFSEVRSVTVQPDGKILAAGYAGSNIALARYNADGSIDTSFSSPKNTVNNRPYTENEIVTLDIDVHIFDNNLAPSGNYAGSTLTIARHGKPNPADYFFSTGTMSTLIEGTYFSVEGITIGRITSNSGGMLVLAYNTNATQELVDKSLSLIGYQNRSDAPSATIALDWTFSDGNTGSQGTGGALATTQIMTLAVTPVNDPVTATMYGLSDHATIGRAYQYDLPATAFADPDSTSFTYSVRMSDGSAVPPWLHIDPATGHISGTPDAFDLGVRHLLVEASDGQYRASINVTIDVRAVNVVAGNATDNALYGTDGVDHLSGLAGNDVLIGYADDDTLIGGDGNDTLQGGAGNDSLDGGSGVDTASYGETAGAVVVDLGIVAAQNTKGAGTDTLIGIENLLGSEYADTLTGNGLANRLAGGNGNDTLTGKGGSDTLDGGAGADKMFGGAGNDIYYVDDSGDRVYETATALSSDTVDLGGSDTVIASKGFVLGRFIEHLTLTGTAASNGTGNAQANRMTGNDGANILKGLAGDDKLNGGAGNDQLIGGDGKDILTGGTGRDYFVFDTAPAIRDTIADFTHAEGDKIRLSKAAFTALAYTGTLHAEDFYAAAGATNAHDASDRVVYNTTTGALYYDADGLGGTAAVQIALLGSATHPALVYGDIQIIA